MLHMWKRDWEGCSGTPPRKFDAGAMTELKMRQFTLTPVVASTLLCHQRFASLAIGFPEIHNQRIRKSTLSPTCSTTARRRM